MNYQTPNSAWTDERVQHLKILLPTGASASAIANELGGGLTRNAVISKVHRSGLEFAHTRAMGSRKHLIARARTPKPRTTFRYAIKPAAGNKAVTLKEAEARRAAAEEYSQFLCAESAADLTPEQRGRTVTLMDIGKYQCRWPLGHPGKPDFCFCGDTQAEGKPYCTPHWRRAHEKALKRA